MRKKFLYIFLFIVLAISSFGSGMVVAEMKIRKLNSLNDSASGNIVIINSETQEAKEKVTLEENVAADEPIPVNSAPSIAETKVIEDDFSFAVIGDTQRFEASDASGAYQQAVKNISKSGAKFLISVGDIVSSCEGKSGC